MGHVGNRVKQKIISNIPVRAYADCAHQVGNETMLFLWALLWISQALE